MLVQAVGWGKPAHPNVAISCLARKNIPGPMTIHHRVERATSERTGANANQRRRVRKGRGNQIHLASAHVRFTNTKDRPTPTYTLWHDLYSRRVIGVLRPFGNVDDPGSDAWRDADRESDNSHDPLNQNQQ